MTTGMGPGQVAGASQIQAVIDWNGATEQTDTEGSKKTTI
jgi:hypothetical protein